MCEASPEGEPEKSGDAAGGFVPDSVATGSLNGSRDNPVLVEEDYEPAAVSPVPQTPAPVAPTRETKYPATKRPPASVELAPPLVLEPSVMDKMEDHKMAQPLAHVALSKRKAAAAVSSAAVPTAALPSVGTPPPYKRMRAEVAIPIVGQPPAAALPDTVWHAIKPTDKVLLIGEGNFSFALALCKIIGTGQGMIATDVEMHHELRTPGGCDGTVGVLLARGATVHCGTDVTKLSTASPWMENVGKFDVLSWAFPHTRTPNRDVKSVPEHRYLLRAFIDEAAILLRPGGKALITVKEGYPYNSWDVEGLKTDVMHHASMEPFLPQDFPEYRHVTTVGAPIAQITPATTHVFIKAGEPPKEDVAL